MAFKIPLRNMDRLARETNLVARSNESPLKIALCYANNYSVAMANLGFQWVYKLFNEVEGVYCDRAFYPTPQEEREYFANKIPLCGIESGMPIRDFDCVAFAFPFELDYIAALKMLVFSGIPLSAAERKRSASAKHPFPLVMAGGIAISANPAPMTDFLDLIVIGDAEPVVKPLCSALGELRNNGEVKEFKDKMSHIQGIYLPGMHTSEESPVQIARSVASEKELPAYQQIFTPDMEFSKLGLIEIMRGCRRGCRFCLEGYIYRPVREAGLDSIIRAIEEVRKYRNKLGLIASVVPDHSRFTELLDYLSREAIPFSVSSLRIEAINERLIEALKKSGNKSITLAPESGSETISRFLNKKILWEKILHSLKIVGKHHFEHVKLYYQIGFPDEKGGDIDAIVESIGQIRDALASGATQKKYPGIIEVGVSIFVPKAWTAFQWLPMADRQELENKMKRLREKFARLDGVVLRGDSIREALLQGIISRGDQELGTILSRLATRDLTPAQLLRDETIVQKYLRARAPEEIFPWDVIKPGVQKNYLYKELNKALAGKLSSGCRDNCKDCGACE